MLKNRFKLIPAVYLLLTQDNSVLLSLRKNTGYADNYYGLVSGHLDGNESASEGMSREAKEEIGLDIPSVDLKMELTMHRLSTDREVIDLFFVLTEWKGTILNLEPEKCADLKYFPINSLPENTIPYIREAIYAISNGEKFIEYGWKENDITI